MFVLGFETTSFPLEIHFPDTTATIYTHILDVYKMGENETFRACILLCKLFRQNQKQKNIKKMYISIVKCVRLKYWS